MLFSVSPQFVLVSKGRSSGKVVSKYASIGMGSFLIFKHYYVVVSFPKCLSFYLFLLCLKNKYRFQFIIYLVICLSLADSSLTRNQPSQKTSYSVYEMKISLHFYVQDFICCRTEFSPHRVSFRLLMFIYSECVLKTLGYNMCRVSSHHSFLRRHETSSSSRNPEIL